MKATAVVVVPALEITKVCFMYPYVTMNKSCKRFSYLRSRLVKTLAASFSVLVARCSFNFCSCFIVCPPYENGGSRIQFYTNRRPHWISENQFALCFTCGALPRARAVVGDVRGQELVLYATVECVFIEFC